ncbi:MAG: response regulator [Bacteroidia bacterium]
MIFLVDDDPIQNMLTSKLIETYDDKLQYKVYQNGEEALEAIKSRIYPDIILLDINMPIMDGWEFLEAYESVKKKAKVFMLTSSNMSDDRNRAADFDCVLGYYTKPINLHDIKDVLAENL